jgi:adenosylhomocysteine nucleosidase
VSDPAPAYRIVFVCAMPRELRPLARKLRLRSGAEGGVSLESGTLAGRPVAGMVTGVGTELAAAATRRLLAAVDVGLVMVVGISGAVDDRTPIGTIIEPALVVDGASGEEFRPAPAGAAGPRGTLWTSDGLITDQATVAGLREHGIVALDMETAAIARECDSRGVRWSVLRAISDRAGDGSVGAGVLRLINADGSANAREIIRYVLGRPSRVIQLVRLARDARLGVTAAAEAAIRACRPD